MNGFHPCAWCKHSDWSEDGATVTCDIGGCQLYTDNQATNKTEDFIRVKVIKLGGNDYGSKSVEGR
jgi:hypothetical protein